MATKNNIHNYDDIIDMPYHKSHRHTCMTRLERGGQFSPFAALTGHKETILETERLTDTKRILDDHQIDVLNQKIVEISKIIKIQPYITVTYFLPDTKKVGGKYVTITGYVKKIDEYDKQLIMKDNQKIPIKDIYDIDICHDHY